MKIKTVSGIMLTLLLTSMLTLTFKIQPTQAQTYYYNFKIKVTPEFPTALDEITATVSFDTASISDIVTFGSVSQIGNEFFVDIDYYVPSGPRLMAIGYAEHTYNLGKLPAGSYLFIVTVMVSGLGSGGGQHSKSFTVGDYLLTSEVCGVDITHVGIWIVFHSWSIGIPENAMFTTWKVRVNVTVHNNGTQTINCTVNAYYYNATATYLMGTQNVTDLNPCNNATLTFNWDVSGLPEEAIYTLKANATCPCGASDEFVYGQVKIRRLGDVNGDGEVDIGDVKKVKLIYSGILPNLFADLNGDCVVDIGDVKKIKLAFSGIL